MNRVDHGVRRCLLVAYCLTASLTAVVSNPVYGRADTQGPSVTSLLTTPSEAATTLSGTVDPDLLTSSVTLAAPSTTEAKSTIVTATSEAATTIRSTTTDSSVTSASSTPPDSSFPHCTSGNIGQFPPFCLPLNGSDMYPGQQYYVTWDTSAFDKNATITIELNYLNVTDGSGSHVWSSPKTPYGYGYVVLETNKDWLQGSTRNNLSLTLVSYSAGTNSVADTHTGPTISLTNKPVAHLPASKSTPPNNLGKYIGIPFGIAFMLLAVGILYIAARRRRLDIKAITSKRHGYGVGKSRRQRVGKKGPIRIEERQVNTSPEDDFEFKDDPDRGLELQQRNLGHGREVDLGSLVNSPARSGFDEAPQANRNVFREEIERQKSGR